MTIHQHHKVEAGILLREFIEAGFDCWKLFYNPVFQTAVNQYGAFRLTHDQLFDVAHSLVLFYPKLIRQPSVK